MNIDPFYFTLAECRSGYILGVPLQTFSLLEGRIGFDHGV
jgi:hypothetical protein